MERKDFIKQGCIACMAFMGAGVLLESCSPGLPLLKTTPVDSKSLSIPLTKFSSGNLLVVRGNGLENDILLVKKENGYKALNLKCTHEGVGLTATDKKIFCSAHGSVFDFNGNVVKEPALRPLTEFRTETTNDSVIIHLI
ncbi:MAG: Rieske (2Fe-2S) protein [Chitinophagaceae bacterium]